MLNGWAPKAGTALTEVIAVQRQSGFATFMPDDLIGSTVDIIFSEPPTAKAPAANPPAGPPAPDAGLVDLDAPAPWNMPGPNWDPLVSPYIPLAADRAAFCNPPSPVFAQPYLIDGFPSSPFDIKPFTRVYKNPTKGQIAATACRPDGHCMRAYDITVKTADLDVMGDTIPGCTGKLTTFLSYNGSVPGDQGLTCTRV